MATATTVRSQKRLLRPLNVSAPIPPSLRGNPLLASLGKVSVATRPVAVCLPSPTMRRRQPSLSVTRDAMEVLRGEANSRAMDQTQTPNPQTLLSTWLDRQETNTPNQSTPSAPTLQSTSNTPAPAEPAKKRGHRRSATTVSISFKPDPIPSTMHNLSSSRLYTQEPAPAPKVHHVRRPSLSLAFSPPSFH
ncbi:hypothetical protein FRC03_012653 [Tulasnella sp. 419]|nr:hypothetical protein FRC03_012653 [Tulasnella sp. 419]